MTREELADILARTYDGVPLTDLRDEHAAHHLEAAHAHDFTKAGRMAEALEHVEAIERLLGVYRRAVGAEKPADRRVAELERVLARAASPEACRWEGRVCVTHSWGSDVGLCPHGEAQQLLGGGA